MVVLELQRLRAELASKLLQSNRKVHLLKLDRIVTEQSRLFERIMPMLEEFESQYASLSRAIEFASHRVGLVNVDLTGGDSHTVQTSLGVATRQLARATELVRPHLATFEALERASTGLKETISKEVTELMELYQLIHKAWILEQQERGLRIEDMQRTKVDEMKRQIIMQPEQMWAKEMFRY